LVSKSHHFASERLYPVENLYVDCLTPQGLIFVNKRNYGSQAPEVLERGQVIFANGMGIEQVKSQQADIALLVIGDTHAESYWLLYPDKHMMLGR
jgi:hypothetical protein